MHTLKFTNYKIIKLLDLWQKSREISVILISPSLLHSQLVHCIFVSFRLKVNNNTVKVRKGNHFYSSAMNSHASMMVQWLLRTQQMHYQISCDSETLYSFLKRKNSSQKNANIRSFTTNLDSSIIKIQTIVHSVRT